MYNYTVIKLRIYVTDANNGFTNRLLGFSIIVSNTTDRRDGVVCFQDTKYTASTIPDKVEISCSGIGRFVFYYNERLPGIHYQKDYRKYAYGNLCEIEVSDKFYFITSSSCVSKQPFICFFFLHRNHYFVNQCTTLNFYFVCINDKYLMNTVIFEVVPLPNLDTKMQSAQSRVMPCAINVSLYFNYTRIHAYEIVLK